ncbi:hypothetical protein ES703_11839 [subsurface metagenome]
MNKSQRLVAGIALILMGIILFVLINLSVYSVEYLSRHVFELYPMILLAIAFTGGGIFVLVSKKKK